MIIKKAVYGGVDCTDQIKKKVVNGRLVIRSDNSIIGDPAVGTRKYLTIDYEYEGVESQISQPEGDIVALPASKTNRLGIFYSNNNKHEIWPSIYESLQTIKRASENKADIICCMWEIMPENPFHQVESWYRSQSHLNQLLQIMQCLYLAKEMGTYEYVSFLEHDVMYGGGYFNYPEFEKGCVLTNMNYGGICPDGWQGRGQNDEPFHQMTMHLDDAIEHCKNILPNALKTNSGNIESDRYKRIQWNSLNECIHINHGIHFTSHNSIYRKDGLYLNHPYWGEHNLYKKLFI